MLSSTSTPPWNASIRPRPRSTGTCEPTPCPVLVISRLNSPLFCTQNTQWKIVLSGLCKTWFPFTRIFENMDVPHKIMQLAIYEKHVGTFSGDSVQWSHVSINYYFLDKLIMKHYNPDNLKKIILFYSKKKKKTKWYLSPKNWFSSLWNRC